MWYGFKLIERRVGGGGAAPQVSKKDASAQDMKKCAVCGAYVSAVAPTNCGRDDCPFSA